MKTADTTIRGVSGIEHNDIEEADPVLKQFSQQTDEITVEDRELRAGRSTG